MDQEQRLSRQSQVPWDAQKQHEARVARMDEIKKELVKLGGGRSETAVPSLPWQFPGSAVRIAFAARYPGVGYRSRVRGSSDYSRASCRI